MVFLGGVGYILKKLSFEMAPLILALVLGPIFEYSFQQSLKVGEGNFLIFLERPTSAIFLLASFISLLLPLIPYFRKKKIEIDEIKEE